MPKPIIHIFNYSVKNQSNKTVDIHIDGDIVDSPTQEMLKNWFGDETSTSFKSLRNQIEKADPKTINLFINSAGGHVGDAMAIHDYLVSLESKGVTVNRNGIGIVASAATYPLMGKNSSMSENSHLLIHNAASFAYGDVNQMEVQVKNVRKFNDSIVNFYSNVTGKDKETIQDWMNNETWFTAQEAKDNGFVNSITGQVQFTNKISPEKWDYKNQDVLSVYNSFTNSNPINMDISKLTEAVTNGFKEIKNLFKNNDKPTDEVIDATINTCTTAIVNAVKEQSVVGIDEAKVTEIVNNILTEKLKDVTKKEDLTNSTKDFVTTEKMTEALTATEKKIVKDISNNVAGGSTEIPGEEEEDPKPRKAKNRYANVKNWQVTDKTPVGNE
jgi:ATP-dependent Clp protease protease subunit